MDNFIGPLQNLAEVAIALTGFSGIIIALLANSTDIKAYQLELGAITIPAASFFVVLFALLPVGLTGLGWENEWMWRVCSFLHAALFITIIWPAIYVFQKNAGPDQQSNQNEKVPEKFLNLSLVVHVLIVLLQLCNGFSLLDLPKGGLFLFGLLIYFVQYFFTFVWLLGKVGQLLIGRKEAPGKDRGV